MKQKQTPDIENKLVAAKEEQGCQSDGLGDWDQQMQAIINNGLTGRFYHIAQGAIFNILI